MSRLAFVFPGQGSQKVGMGKDLHDRYPLARELFSKADEALGFGLSELCFNGPEEKLKLTAYTQPALLTMSYVAFRLLDLEPVVAAGHSLGEYSALVAVGQPEVRGRAGPRPQTRPLHAGRRSPRRGGDGGRARRRLR